MGEDRFSYGYKYRIDLYVATAIFVATIFGLAAIHYLLKPYPSFIPRVSISELALFMVTNWWL